MPKEMISNQKKDASNEIVCVLRYRKQQFIEKGDQATPLATEFHWNAVPVPMPRGGSCGIIQKMLRVSL